MRSLLLLALLAAVLPLAACSSDGPPGRGLGGLFDDGWTKSGTAPHPALRSDVVIATWARGSGLNREIRRALATPDGEVAPASIGQLSDHVVPPTSSARAAQKYAELAQLLGISGTPVPGDPVLPGDDPGGSGTYGPSDAHAWKIPFDPEPLPYGGGYEVQLVVLIPPIRHAVLSHSSPWRLVRLVEVVYPDGGIQGMDQKTLSNGDAAARYARF